MADVKQITAMCRAGQIQAAYDLAKTDQALMPTYPWVEEEVGWALYYMIKADRSNHDVDNFNKHRDEFYALELLIPSNYQLLHTRVQGEIGWSLYYNIKDDSESGNYNSLLSNIDKLQKLELLTVANDSMIFDNMQLQIANFIKNHIFLNDIESSAKLSTLFQKLKLYTFNPSFGHSLLLQSYIKFENWSEMADFFDWWNLDELRPEDYVPYINQNGQRMITLAERAFIANSKALLKLNDLGRIELFLPKLDALMNAHPEFMYPGYFYGKLLLKLGSNVNEALKVIVPFARKKASEFWVWQLLSDVFSSHDSEKQLACLLRAVNSGAKEVFLGKVRIKLANFYILNNQLDRAKFQIDCITRCYAPHGWTLPYEVECWIHQPWINTVKSNPIDPINYMNITNNILCDGTDEAIAIVTYVDQNSHRASMIYGKEMRMAQKLRFKVGVGAVLKINYIKDSEGHAKILSASKTQLPKDLTYAKVVEGAVSKSTDKSFAFLKSAEARCFIAPNIVQKYNVTDNDQVKALIVYDFDKKKSAWNWVCVSIRK